jgi:pimeloyl-ACP methyl ester carboxylesterase
VLAGVSLAGVPVTGKRDDARDGVAGMVDLTGDAAAMAAALGALHLHAGPSDPGVLAAGAAAALVPRSAVRRIVEEEFFLDDSDRLLPGLTQPWLFVVPGADTAEPPEYQLAQAELLPDHRVVVLDGEGHMVPQERPELVAGHISAFLNEVL